MEDIYLPVQWQVQNPSSMSPLMQTVLSVELKQLLQMFTIHNNLPLAYQCCSTILRLVLKYRTNLTAVVDSPTKRTRDHEVVLSAKSLDELIEHLDTAMGFLLTETIQSNRIKLLQVTFI